MATKSKKTRKVKNDTPTEVVTQQSQKVSPPAKKRMLPHNMAHEISLLQERVAKLEQTLESILSQK
jgi:hypothetical protein